MRNLNLKMFMVMFKLETDISMIDKKVLSSMSKYKVDLTVGNMLQTFKNKVTIYTLE